MRGWKDARVELVTVGTVSAFLTLGYVKHVGGLSFTEWDALR